MTPETSTARWPSWLQPEWAVLDTLRAHRYDIADRGSKPDDPGWHVCSCGWEGYWCDFQPHIAERIVARLAALEDEQSEWVERKVTRA